MKTLETVLDEIRELDLSTQELLLEVLQRRIVEARRKEIVQNAAEAESEYRSGKAFKGSAAEVIKKLKEG